MLDTYVGVPNTFSAVYRGQVLIHLDMKEETSPCSMEECMREGVYECSTAAFLCAHVTHVLRFNESFQQDLLKAK